MNDAIKITNLALINFFHHVKVVSLSTYKCNHTPLSLSLSLNNPYNLSDNSCSCYKKCWVKLHAEIYNLLYEV